MLLKSLDLYQFRGYARGQLSFQPRFTVLSGANGAGKTNVLEAIYLGCRLHSFRTRSFAALCQQATRGFSVRLRFVRRTHQGAAGESSELQQAAAVNAFTLNFHQGTRQFQLNASSVSPQAVLHKLPLVMLFTSDDILLIQGSAALRRTFLDRALEQYDPHYKILNKNYQNALIRRNKTLRRGRVIKGQLSALELWDQHLAQSGAGMLAARAEFITALAPLTTHIFARLSGGAQLQLAYQLKTLPAIPVKIPLSRSPFIPPTAAQYLKHLRLQQRFDLQRGYTTFGPHSDELMISLDGSLAQNFASQGESRTLAHALKLAVAELTAKRRRCRPVYLLDDVFAELDDAKLSSLFAWLATQGQSVFTCAQPGLVLPYIRPAELLRVPDAVTMER